MISSKIILVLEGKGYSLLFDKVSSLKALSGFRPVFVEHEKACGAFAVTRYHVITTRRCGSILVNFKIGQSKVSNSRTIQNSTLLTLNRAIATVI